MRDVSLAEIVDQLLRLPQRREAEERCGRTADGPAHGADALLDLVLGIVLVGLGLAVDQALALGLRQILVTPGMRADGVAGGGNLLEDAGLVGGMQADREEDRLGAVRGERGEHGRRVLRPGAVVEGQHDLAFAQEIMALKCSKPKPGPPVVSISTVRATPERWDCCRCVAAGAAGAACATTIGCSRRAGSRPGGSARALVPTAGACPSPGAARAGEGAGPETEVLCKKIAPNTAAHKRIASADAIAARRMSDLWDAASPGTPWTSFRLSLIPHLIPSPIDHNSCAHWRNPRDMMRQG